MKTWSLFRSRVRVTMELYLSLFFVATTAAETHSYITLYTASKQPNIPWFTALSFVDGHEIDYYDSNIMKVVPRQEWVKETPDYWNEHTSRHQQAQEEFMKDFDAVNKQFNHSGITTFQRMFGCELSDDGSSEGFDNYGYNGQDFISLDLNTMTYIAATPQAVIFKQRWESDITHMALQRHYYSECVDRLKNFVNHNNFFLKRRVTPEVYLLQKDSSSPVVCFATGFYPKAVMLSWQKNGEDLFEDVELTETLSNGDGTFQKKSFLHVGPEEQNMNEYSCVVQHMNQGIILTASEIKTNYVAANTFYIELTAVVTLAIICNVFIWIFIVKCRKGDKMYIKTNPDD
ncbi:major histocompatibility complex class I-related gene protein-like [Colossoma macropomum]|uniref:major histocompatibility complex class I-related gene protein-like n=1 Tax=Colossoma macropomum TaxID=42526 RepID=UPI001864773E|nr:major histocompatibility complex class I-related gene protein-like [Colossoma macropomum]